MRILLAFLLTAAGGVSAQNLTFSPAATEACLQQSATQSDQLACIGHSAQACMTNNPGGDTTVGMIGCFDREWQYWDARLNAVYKRKMAEAKAIDAEMVDIGATVPSQSDALREMQRAWIPFRDGKCGYEYSHWGGGTGGGPAITACMMAETGEQALYLEHAGLGG